MDILAPCKTLVHMTNDYKALIEKKKLLTKHIWKEKNKMGLNEIGSRGADWAQEGQSRAQWRFFLILQ
jgi:hypothetical protein